MTISSITSNSTNTGTSVLQTGKATYGDNPFLQLLTTQLQNQSPLEPVDNESFMNQMASYTSMQEQRDLNSNLLKLLDYQGALARVQGLSQGSALLGKDVTYAGSDGKELTGKVESVFVAEDGDVRLKLEGGKEIGLREIIGIAETPATTGTTSGTTSNGSSSTNTSSSSSTSTTDNGAAATA
ncbi:MAG: flagellar hook capping protein [Planctomycetes bacterium]|nr:flagellar hook capping protein [Planctomycetota bacterium]